MAEEKEGQEQSSQDKIGKAFESNFKKLVALMGGKGNLKKPSIPNDEVGDIITELLVEERVAIIDKFKTDAKSLLKAKLEFDKECKKAEELYINTVNTKKKEFTEKMVDLFKVLENINGIEASYYTSIKEVKDAVAPAVTTEPEKQ
jgi:hypothetical protein